MNYHGFSTIGQFERQQARIVAQQRHEDFFRHHPEYLSHHQVPKLEPLEHAPIAAAPSAAECEAMDDMIGGVSA